MSKRFSWRLGSSRRQHLRVCRERDNARGMRVESCPPLVMAQKYETKKGGEGLNGHKQTKDVIMTNGGRVVQVDWEVIENTIQVKEEHWSWMGWRARRERMLLSL